MNKRNYKARNQGHNYPSSSKIKNEQNNRYQNKNFKRKWDDDDDDDDDDEQGPIKCSNPYYLINKFRKFSQNRRLKNLAQQQAQEPKQPIDQKIKNIDVYDCLVALKLEKQLKNEFGHQFLIRFPDPLISKQYVENFIPGFISNVFFPVSSAQRFCFANLSDSFDKKAALEIFNKIDYFGMGKVHAEFKTDLNEKDDNPLNIDPYRLFVGNIGLKTPSQLVKDLFKPKRIDLMPSKTIQKKKCAILRYSTCEEALKAFKINYNKEIDGSSLNVRFYRLAGSAPSRPGKVNYFNLELLKALRTINKESEIEKLNNLNLDELGQIIKSIETQRKITNNDLEVVNYDNDIEIIDLDDYPDPKGNNLSATTSSNKKKKSDRLKTESYNLENIRANVDDLREVTSDDDSDVSSLEPYEIKTEPIKTEEINNIEDINNTEEINNRVEFNYFNDDNNDEEDNGNNECPDFSYLEEFTHPPYDEMDFIKKEPNEIKKETETNDQSDNSIPLEVSIPTRCQSTSSSSSSSSSDGSANFFRDDFDLTDEKSSKKKSKKSKIAKMPPNSSSLLQKNKSSSSKNFFDSDFNVSDDEWD